MFLPDVVLQVPGGTARRPSNQGGVSSAQWESVGYEHVIPPGVPQKLLGNVVLREARRCDLLSRGVEVLNTICFLTARGGLRLLYLHTPNCVPTPFASSARGNTHTQSCMKRCKASKMQNCFRFSFRIYARSELQLHTKSNGFTARRGMLSLL